MRLTGHARNAATGRKKASTSDVGTLAGGGDRGNGTFNLIRPNHLLRKTGAATAASRDVGLLSAGASVAPEGQPPVPARLLSGALGNGGARWGCGSRLVEPQRCLRGAGV